MRVLLVKTSSLGDVIHTLPALTDAARAIPGIQFDWVVEEGFAEIPAWHPAVARVIPVAIRRWRKNLWQTLRNGEWRRFKQRLKEVDYDLVIDAQGLLKSAWLTRYVGKTPVAGLDRDSAREPLASRFYRRAYPVAWGQHAVERTRQLFAQALDYPLPESVGDYGLDREQLADADPGAPYLVFLHGTTWDTKHWPEATGANWPSACASAAGRCACPGAAPPSGSGPGAWRRGWKMPRYSPDYPWPAWPRCLPRARLRGGGYRPRSPGGGAGRADAVAVRPDQSWLHRRYGRSQVHLGSDFPCAPCLKKTCTYQPTEEDRKLFDLKREQPLCFTRLNPQRVATQLEAMLLAPETLR